MATIEDLAATMKTGLDAAYNTNMVDADRAGYTMRGLAKLQAQRFGADIDNYTDPADFLQMAGVEIRRALDNAWNAWDAHLREDSDSDGVPDAVDPDPLDPTIPNA